MNAWSFRITAQHIMGNISSDLYPDRAACLWEIVRNGVVACMPNGSWKPGVGEVEVMLVNKHPLSPQSTALVVLDRGSGFTEPSIRLFCAIGRALDDKQADNDSGAAQKRIGRFAAFALNQSCLENGDPHSGYYILTRTAKQGPVRFVSMIPAQIEQAQQVVPKEIDDASAELGNLRGIKGSFTAIVIPNSVFQSYSEISEALLYRLPRKRNQAFKLTVGNKALIPPPLPSKVVVVQQNKRPGTAIEAYLDRLDNLAQVTSSGIMFVDAVTGLRVASATKIGPAHLPYPFWRADLLGDVFIPGLLANQDTSRSGLSARFLRSATWKNACLFLVGAVGPHVKHLLGDEDTFSRSSVSRSIEDFVRLCQQVWGEPTVPVGPAFSNGVGSGTNSHTRKKCQPSESDTSESTDSGKSHKPRPKVLPFKIGDKTYFLARRTLDPRLLAEVDMSSGKVIQINDRDYQAMPARKDARQEHVIMSILWAVARSMHLDPHEGQIWVNERRSDLLRK